MKDDREMPNDSQHDPRTIELDPDLLSAPFRVQTNWHVITGAACSGKTTLSHCNWTAPGLKMTRTQFFSTSGSSAITVPWDIAW
jgi:hypothetical protein